MSASLKLRQLESKFSILRAQQQQLLIERQKEIAELITSLDLASLDDNVLLGGLLFLKEKIITQDPMVEAWQEAGLRFLRRTKQKKHTHSKGTKASYPTNQSVEKRHSSGGEKDVKAVKASS